MGLSWKRRGHCLAALAKARSARTAATLTPLAATTSTVASSSADASSTTTATPNVNQPTAEEVLIPNQESASKRKLAYFGTPSAATTAGSSLSLRTVVELDQLSRLIVGLLCPQ